MVSASITTYADMVDFARKAEEAEGNVRTFRMLEGLLGRPGVARPRDNGNQHPKEQVDFLRKD